jgi:hypothetical protein
MGSLELQESNLVLAGSWTVGSRSRVFFLMEDPLAFGLENLFKNKNPSVLGVGQIFLIHSFRSNESNFHKNLWFEVQAYS